MLGAHAVVFSPPPPVPGCAPWERVAGWGVPPPRSTPRRPHTLSARDCSEGRCPLSLAPCMPCAGRVRCRFSSPSSVSLLYYPAVPLVASWPSLLPRSPVLSGSITFPVGASKPYLRRASAPYLGLVPSVPEVCLVKVPALPLSAAVLGPPI